MSIAHKRRGVFCSPRKGEQCSGTKNNGKKQFHHFSLKTDSIGRHFIPGISMVLIMAVLLVSTTAYAHRRNDGKHHHHYRPEPVSCVDLADGLADNPDVKFATSDITPASGSNVAYCQVDIL